MYEYSCHVSEALKTIVINITYIHNDHGDKRKFVGLVGVIEIIGEKQLKNTPELLPIIESQCQLCEKWIDN